MALADALLISQASVTSTAAANGSTLTLDGRTARRKPTWMQIGISAANTSAGAGTLVFAVQASSDNATFYDHHLEPTVILSTTAQAKQIFIPLVDAPRYVRAILKTITGTDATVTWDARIVATKP
jgi:hypothetical protein